MKIVEVETTTGVKKMDEEVSVEQDHLITVVSNGQRGRIEEQRCSMGPRTSQQVPAFSSDPEEIYELRVNSESRRLDDQRAMLSSLSGIEAFTVRDQKEANAFKTNFDHICNMVSNSHSFRRRTPPRITLTSESPGSSPSQPSNHSELLNKLPSRSASYSPISNKVRLDSEGFQGEQDRLFSLVSQAQCGRIEDQRCSINPLSHLISHMDNIHSDQDAEKFFTLIANTQNRRKNDQRATLNLFPGTLASTARESDQFFNMVSRLQGSRIDDQRCSAPQIQLGSPAPPRKSHSRPASPTAPPESDSPSKSPWRSTLFTPVSEVQKCIDEEQFFSLIHHAQQRRMDDQRCSFEPSKHSSFTPKNSNTALLVEDPEQFFKLVADSQSRRMDDQRVSLNSLPGLQASSAGNHRKQNQTSAPQIILTPASPAAPKKAHSRPASPTLMLCDSEPPVRPPPRSASFSPVSDKERLLYDDMPTQLTFQISMHFPPQAYGTDNQPCQFPEIFLTIGQPGETIVLPLNPKPGRPVSLNLNPPEKQHSSSASPHRSRSRQECGRPSSPNPENVTSPVSPHEDYFSLIQRVHTAQLQQNNGQKREEMSREAKKQKGKNGGRKEKKEGTREKKK